MKLIEYDFEAKHRQKRLAQRQEHIDVFILAAWITTLMLTCVWIRVMYLCCKAGVAEVMAWVGK